MTTVDQAGPVTGPTGRPWSSWLPLVAVVAVMAAFAASRLAVLGVPSEREYDEGVYLLSARALVRGHALFTDVFSSQPPAFLETLAAWMRIAGDTMERSRLLVVGFALVAIAAIADLGRRIAGPWAAPCAAAALAFGSTFGDLAHLVQAETPALALALASLDCCLRARDRGWSRGWLVASGAVFGLAALFKLLVLPLVIPLALLLALAPGSGQATDWVLDGRGLALARRFVSRCWPLAAGAMLVAGLPLLFYDHAALYEQTVHFHVLKRSVYRLDPASNLRRAWKAVDDDPAVLAAALAGILALARTSRLRAAWIAAAAVSAAGFLAAQTPIFWRHFVLLASPLALAASGVPLLAARARSASARGPLAGVLAVAALAALAWPAVVRPDLSSAMFPPSQAYLQRDREELPVRRAAAWISSHTAADEPVVSDDPIVVYLAGRQSPGELCDTSSARIHTGSLDLEKAVRETAPVRIVVLRGDGRLSHLRGYRAWLARHYDLEPASRTGLGSQRAIWIRRERAER